MAYVHARLNGNEESEQTQILDSNKLEENPNRLTNNRTAETAAPTNQQQTNSAPVQTPTDRHTNIQKKTEIKKKKNKRITYTHRDRPNE